MRASGSGNVGRPRLQVDVEEVAEMRKIGICITKISEVIGVSRSTLYRALEGSNLIGVTDISNQELDEVLSSSWLEISVTLIRLLPSRALYKVLQLTLIISLILVMDIPITTLPLPDTITFDSTICKLLY